MKESIWMTATQVSMFFSFLLARLAVQIYITFWFICPWLLHTFFESEVAMAYKVLLVEISIGVVVNFSMNAYWGGLIFNQGYRMVFKGAKDTGANITKL